MKVKVRYYGMVEEVVDVDDKFKEILPAWDSGDDDKYDELTDDLIQVIKSQIPGDLSQLFDNENGELLCEI